LDPTTASPTKSGNIFDWQVLRRLWALHREALRRWVL